jgi:hypothetical protein
MNKVVVDPATRDKLINAHQKLELCDDAGAVLGLFIPVENCSSHSGREPRISAEELDRRERAGGGRPLADILADLEKRL